MKRSNGPLQMAALVIQQRQSEADDANIRRTL